MTDIMYANGFDGNGTNWTTRAMVTALIAPGPWWVTANSTSSMGCQGVCHQRRFDATIDDAWGSQIHGPKPRYGVNSSWDHDCSAKASGPAHWHPIVYSYSGTCSGGVYSGERGVHRPRRRAGRHRQQHLSYGYAMAINNAGTVTGYAPSGRNSNYSHAFVLTSPGTATDLGALSRLRSKPWRGHQCQRGRGGLFH